MSRKRGKQRKAPVEAVPDDVLAEGSGPVRRVDKDAVTTVDDVVTTDDVVTPDDVVVTPDDIVATTGSSEAGQDADPTASDEKPDTGGDTAREAPGARDKASRSARRGQKRGRGGKLKPAAAAPVDREPGGGERADDGGDAPEHDHASQAADAGDAAAHGDGDADARDAAAHGGSAAREAAADSDGVPSEVSDRGDGESLEGSGGGDREVLDASDDLDAAAHAASFDEPEGSDGSDSAEGIGEGDAEGEGQGQGDGDDDGATVFPASAANMDAAQFKHLVEALIFASDRPLTIQRLRQLTRVSDVRRLQQVLGELTEDYRERGVVLQQVSGGYQFRTRTQFSAWVQQLIAGRPVRLSRAQLETLAIIAYRQPITRPEIDDIRGVDSTATLKLLMDRMLIRVLGKREEVGRPMLYGTTKEFLDFFSLGDLRELPTLREYSELTAESRKVMSERLGIPPDGVDGSGGGDGGTGGAPGTGSGGDDGPEGDGSGGGDEGGGGGVGGGGGGPGGGASDGGGPDPGLGEVGFGDVSDLADDIAPGAAFEAASDIASAFWAAADAVEQSEAAILEDVGVEIGAEIGAEIDAEIGADIDAEIGADIDAACATEDGSDGERVAPADRDAMATWGEHSEITPSAGSDVDRAVGTEPDDPVVVQAEVTASVSVETDPGDSPTGIRSEAATEDRAEVVADRAMPSEREVAAEELQVVAAEELQVVAAEELQVVAAEEPPVGAAEGPHSALDASDIVVVDEAPVVAVGQPGVALDHAADDSRDGGNITESAPDAFLGSVLHPAASYESPVQDDLVDASRRTPIDPTLE